MENISHFPHSLSKKPHTSKSSYDDVFSGAHKFSATSLAPRLEDYTEIFGGFHASRGRSAAIPLLDLPPVNDDDDVDRIGVCREDYCKVFGGFRGVEFAASFEDLVNAANGGYYSSDEAWSPAHSGSLSEETDPSAFSERSHSTTMGDLHNPVNGIEHFNLSYHKAQQRSDGDNTTGMSNITHLHAIPGYTCIVEEKVASENHRDEQRHHQGTNDPNYKEGFGVRVAEDETSRENVSLTMNNEFSQIHGSRLKPWETRSKSGPILNEPLVTVSDVSLRTKPSHLPPPSRPPPILGGEFGITHPKPKTSRSLSVASLEDALCRIEDNLRNSANSTDLRDEGFQTSLNLQMEMENNIECLSSHKDGKEECTSMHFDLGNNTVGHAVQWSQEEDLEKIWEVVSDEERRRLMKARDVVSDGIYGEIEINARERSRKYKPRKDHISYLGSSKSEEIVSWREEAEYFEVETDFYRKDYKQSKEDTIGNNDVESFENQGHSKTATKQKESCDNSKLEKMAPEKQDKLIKGESVVPGDGRLRETSRSIFQMEDQKSVQVIGSIDAPKTNKEEHMVMHYEEIKKVLYTGKSMETRDEDGIQHENVTDTDLYMKEASERTEKNFSNANSKKESEMMSEEVFEIDHLMKSNNESEQTVVEDKGDDRQDEEEREKQLNELLERPLNKEIQKGAHIRLGPKTSESIEQKDDDSTILHMSKRVDVHHAHEQYKKNRELSLTREVENNLVKECHKLEEVEMEMPRSSKEDKFGTEEKEAYQREHEEKLGGDRGSNVYEISSKEALDHNKSRTSFTRDLCEEGTKKKSLEACEKKDEGTGFDGTLTQKAKVDELKKNVTKEEFDSSKSSPLVINEKPTHEVQCIDEVSHVVEGRHNMNFKNLGLSRKVNSREISVNTSEQFRPVSSTASVNVSEKPFNNVAMIPPRVVSSDQEVKVTFPEVPRVECVTGLQVTVGDGILMEKLRKPQLSNEWVDNAKNISDALQTVLVDIGDIHDDYKAEASQGTPTKVNNMSRIRFPEEPKIEKRLRNDGELKHESYMTTKEERERQMQREKDPMAKTQKVGRLKGRELHDEHLKRAEEEREREKDLMAKTQKVGRLKGRELHDEHLKRAEEEREREREREKDRTAVENTIREARERAYVDARERAALERATSEARQRAMAEARERLEKASAEAREARLKAERAAVERATAEARQRAFEKAMSTKCNSETNDRVDRASDKFPSKDMKQNGRSCDSCNIQIQNGPCYTNSSAQVGVEGESPQRCKARLERYQRTTERAAKALAEKNMRDLVAQREQEERSRLAEILDADVKRWSSGKEGNLRALLSTLQYILGPDSGWQPIPLTQVITSAAVKRAYRKATLCVHPDKLQQRGANTQQKYICEKVFDLLKEAWNKFNSEER